MARLVSELGADVIDDTIVPSKVNKRKRNFIVGFSCLGVGLIALGMVLMIGGGSSDPNVFNKEMFNFRRLTLAPILILAGFVVEIFAIFWKKKTPNS